MRFLLDQMPIQLSAARPLSVSDAEGSSLRVLHGRVWITQEGSPDDHFLEAGDGHAFGHGGKAIVSAENARGGIAVVAFEAPIAIRAVVTPTDRLRRIASRLVGRLRPQAGPARIAQSVA